MPSAHANTLTGQLTGNFCRTGRIKRALHPPGNLKSDWIRGIPYYFSGMDAACSPIMPYSPETAVNNKKKREYPISNKEYPIMKGRLARDIRTLPLDIECWLLDIQQE